MILSPLLVMWKHGLTSNMVSRIRFASSRAKSFIVALLCCESASKAYHQSHMTWKPSAPFPLGEPMPLHPSLSFSSHDLLFAGQTFDPSLPLWPHQAP